MRRRSKTEQNWLCSREDQSLSSSLEEANLQRPITDMKKKLCFLQTLAYKEKVSALENTPCQALGKISGLTSLKYGQL
jgi:hypothetical protein